jgi:predicted RNase H-like nuclease (RuvC/YqgF family)
MALNAKSIKYEIEITERGFVKLTEKISGLQRYLKDANAASTAITNNLKKQTKAHGRTVDVIQKEIASQRTLLNTTAKTNQEYIQGALRIQTLENELRELTKTQSQVNVQGKLMSKRMGNVATSTGSASGAVVEISRTISDANYGMG